MGRQSIEIQIKNTDDYGYNEALKTLRTNLQFCGSNIHTIMFTSSVPDEGKSDIAFSTASALAQIGKKVLLVDADIRKSVLATRFQLKQKVDGLSQYLSGQKALADVIYDTNYENLSMVLAGPYAPNPAELLEEVRHSGGRGLHEFPDGSADRGDSVQQRRGVLCGQHPGPGPGGDPGRGQRPDGRRSNLQGQRLAHLFPGRRPDVPGLFRGYRGH